ncbi:hypothetical protein D3C87_162860 [compost metagenome]
MRLLLFSLFFLTSSAFAAVLVTQTVGQVADYVVTSREVQISTVIEGILFPSAKREGKGLVEVQLGQEAFNKDLTATLLEVVVGLEAENFNVGAINEAELNAAVVTVEKAVAGKAYWNALEVSNKELRRLVKRKIESKNFLKFRTNSMSGIISDQEAHAYYEKNRVKFGSLPFASFKDNIKTFLSQQQLEERLRSWFEVIKRKYKVRNFLSE